VNPLELRLGPLGLPSELGRVSWTLDSRSRSVGVASPRGLPRKLGRAGGALDPAKDIRPQEEEPKQRQDCGGLRYGRSAIHVGKSKETSWPGWIRTTTAGSKDRCPAIRRRAIAGIPAMGIVPPHPPPFNPL
jgi:hypothetical protein